MPAIIWLCITVSKYFLYMQLFAPFRVSSDIPTNFSVLLPECIFRVKEKSEITAVKNRLQLHKPALDYRF